MGLVIFSGFAELAVPPTTDRTKLIETIDTVTTGSRDGDRRRDAEGARRDRRGQPGRHRRSATPRPRAPHRHRGVARSDDYVADIIVLLTDGRNTRGIEPLDAVPHAVERRVRVYTIGFGTTNPRSGRARAPSSAAESSRAAARGSVAAPEAASEASSSRTRPP